MVFGIDSKWLKYLLNPPYFILDYPSVTGFLIINTVFYWRIQTLPYAWEKNHNIEQHLRLVIHIFTKHSQNMYLINIQTLMYRHVRCDCNLWNALWFYFVFGSFHSKLTSIHVWSIVFSPNFHRLYVWFEYINMPNVAAVYGRFFDLIRFFFGKLYYWYLKRYDFIKFIQIEY